MTVRPPLLCFPPNNTAFVWASRYSLPDTIPHYRRHQHGLNDDELNRLNSVFAIFRFLGWNNQINGSNGRQCHVVIIIRGDYLVYGGRFGTSHTHFTRMRSLNDSMFTFDPHHTAFNMLRSWVPATNVIFFIFLKNWNKLSINCSISQSVEIFHPPTEEVYCEFWDLLSITY